MRVPIALAAIMLAGFYPLCRPAAAQEAPAVLRAGGPSFMYARYATRSSWSLYATSGLGPASLMVGMVQDLGSSYREIVGGVLSTVSYGQHAITAALAYADATDARYLQVYALPDVRAGAISLLGVMGWYIPLDRSGTRQLYVNPVMVLAHARPWLALGGSYALGIAQGAGTSVRAGPVLQLRLSPIVITFELLRGIERSRNELRISLQAS